MDQYVNIGFIHLWLVKSPMHGPSKVQAAPMMIVVESVEFAYLSSLDFTSDCGQHIVEFHQTIKVGL